MRLGPQTSIEQGQARRQCTLGAALRGMRIPAAGFQHCHARSVFEPQEARRHLRHLAELRTVARAGWRVHGLVCRHLLRIAGFGQAPRQQRVAGIQVRQALQGVGLDAGQQARGP